MELRQLEYFVVVAEELSFTRAAERLHITQPPLSAQIKALEDEIDATLFERSTRKVRLTEAGELFWASSVRWLAQLRENIIQAQRADSGEIGQLTVGFVPSAMMELLPPIFRAFRGKFPAVKLILKELLPEQQVQGLISGSLDCSFFYLPPKDKPPFDEPALTSIAVSREPLVAAIPRNHPLAKHQRVPLSALAAEPLVTVAGHRGSGLRDAINEQCRVGGIMPEVVQEAALVQTVAGLVASGVGIALLPASIARLQRIGVTYRSLEGRAIKVRMGLVWPKIATNPVLRGFVDIARQVGRDQSGRSTG